MDRNWPFAEIGGDEKHGRFIAAYRLKAVIYANNKTLAASTQISHSSAKLLSDRL
jgi:hypothetical protein